MRALISVYDKTGLATFARGLAALDVELVASGGTAGFLADVGLEVTKVESLTAFPKILGGRVKTLHPRVHAGILARRDVEEDVRALEEHAIEPFDLVCVNLYPFEEAAAGHGVTEEEAVELIDVGGPAMLRGAAKNFAHCAPVSRPEDYELVLEELRASGELSKDTRRRARGQGVCGDGSLRGRDRALVCRARDVPGHPHAGFRQGFGSGVRGEPAPTGGVLRRAGSAPAAALSRRAVAREAPVVQQPERPLRGPPAHPRVQAAGVRDRQALQSLRRRGCGDDRGGVCESAGGRPRLRVRRRRGAQPRRSATLGISLTRQFIEVLFAPGFDEQAMEVLARKPSTRVLNDTERRAIAETERNYSRVLGGLLVQDRDWDVAERDGMDLVCGELTEREWGDLLFAWRAVKHVTSNAIVLAKELRTIGVGAGQMSRVDAVRMAVEKAKELGHDLGGAVLASDAFFPFADGPALALEAGVTAIIQPGGSKRDDEVIQAVAGSAGGHGLHPPPAFPALAEASLAPTPRADQSSTRAARRARPDTRRTPPVATAFSVSTPCSVSERELGHRIQSADRACASRHQDDAWPSPARRSCARSRTRSGRSPRPAAAARRLRPRASSRPQGREILLRLLAVVETVGLAGLQDAQTDPEW